MDFNTTAAFSPHSTPSEETEAGMVADRLRTGGRGLNTYPNGDPYCDGSVSDCPPCFDCFEREGS